MFKVRFKLPSSQRQDADGKRKVGYGFPGLVTGSTVKQPGGLDRTLGKDLYPKSMQRTDYVPISVEIQPCPTKSRPTSHNLHGHQRGNHSNHPPSCPGHAGRPGNLRRGRKRTRYRHSVMPRHGAWCLCRESLNLPIRYNVENVHRVRSLTVINPWEAVTANVSAKNMNGVPSHPNRASQARLRKFQCVCG